MGLKYRSASGDKILNEGERDLRGYSNEANMIDMTAQVAAVTKPLGSVRAFLEAGNRVVFDKGDSFIQNKTTGVKTAIEDRNGAYVFDLWIPRGNQVQQSSGYQGKLWQAFAVDQDSSEANQNMDLVGRDDLM